MKVGAITGPMQGTLVDKPEPKPKNDIVVVKIHAIPMCTEYQAFRGGHAGDCFGHEAAGEVVAVDRATKVKVGDRVVVQPLDACGRCHLCLTGNYIHCESRRDLLAETGSWAGTATMAEYLIKSESLLTPIPDGMSYDHASMACCGLGPTFGAMQLTDVDAFDTVLISGLGPVGLGGAINARFRGARVIGLDSHPFRAELARQLGAVAVVDPKDPDAMRRIMDLTGGMGVDKGIETSGTADAKPFLLNAMRRKGRVALIGWSGQLDANTIIAKGLGVFGAWHYNLKDADRLMQVIAAVPEQLDKLITHRMPLADIQSAWELQVTGNCGKVILHPWGE